MLRLFTLWLLTISLSGCAIYTVEREWEARMPSGFFGKADTPSPRFRADLRECIAKHHPDHLADLDAGREYPLYGWFINKKATSQVIRCMEPKGWTIMGPSI